MPVNPSNPYPVQFDGTNGTPALTTITGAYYRGGYCTPDDLQGLFFNQDLWSKIQNNPDIWATHIADVSQDIDRALEPYYVTPLSGTNALEAVRFIAKHMAAASLYDAMMLQGFDEPAQAQHAAKASVVHQETGSQRLDDIVSGATQLFDAVTQPGGERPSFPTGKAARWSPEATPTWMPVGPNDETSALFGTRQNPATVDDRWIP